MSGKSESKSTKYFTDLHSCVPEIKPAAGTIELSYHQYLCTPEYRTILETLEKAVKDENVHTVLFRAGCGSGKTYMFLTELGKWCYENGICLILLVPNTLTNGTTASGMKIIRFEYEPVKKFYSGLTYESDSVGSAYNVDMEPDNIEANDTVTITWEIE